MEKGDVKRKWKQRRQNQVMTREMKEIFVFWAKFWRNQKEGKRGERPR
jgi:hypothetical protein